MADLEKVIEHAEKHCKANGARLTEKRKCVLSGLLLSEKALSAYELVEVCKKAFGESIPAMSVYRILDFLEQEHLVHKLNLANKYVACSHITCDHSHEIQQFLICSNCQKVKEISVSKSAIKAIESDVQEAGFQLVKPQIEVNCICDDCLASVA